VITDHSLRPFRAKQLDAGVIVWRWVANPHTGVLPRPLARVRIVGGHIIDMVHWLRPGLPSCKEAGVCLYVCLAYRSPEWV
jgi:hypothetical protein